MKAEYILQSNLLDILFENRNKQYGAYQLRSSYNRQLYKALGFVFVITTGMLFLSQLKSKEIREIIFDIPPTDVVKLPIPEAPPTPQKVNPPKPSGAPEASTAFPSHITLTTDSTQVSLLPANLDSVAIGSSNIPGTGKKIIGEAPGPVEPARGPMANVVDKLTPLSFAEVMPEFPGGKNALQKFLERNLNSPTEIEMGESVSVKIKFVVGYDGVLKGFEIVEDGGKLFNNEVVRVLKKMPQWIPGKSRGESVSVYYTIPVKFTAQD
ncbi:MAG: energy transducer TonB [Ferruginibacter sp.]